MTEWETGLRRYTLAVRESQALLCTRIRAVGDWALWGSPLRRSG